METPADAIATYILAKDGNRPHLIEAAFAPAADLEMVVRAGAISFPPRSAGRDAIAEVLVRRFGERFENVYTFCLASPPGIVAAFSCDWLVGMSEKVGGAVRVGCGRYDWRFQERAPHLATGLAITIQRMETMSPDALGAVMRWLSDLPYPWCSTELAARSIPPFGELSDVGAFLRRQR